MLQLVRLSRLLQATLDHSTDTVTVHNVAPPWHSALCMCTFQIALHHSGVYAGGLLHSMSEPPQL